MNLSHSHRYVCTRDDTSCSHNTPRPSANTPTNRASTTRSESRSDILSQMVGTHLQQRRVGGNENRKNETNFRHFLAALRTRTLTHIAQVISTKTTWAANMRRLVLQYIILHCSWLWKSFEGAFTVIW